MLWLKKRIEMCDNDHVRDFFGEKTVKALDM